VKDAPSQTPQRHGASALDSRAGEPNALRITIEPTRSARKWIARLGDRVLCIAAAPLIKSARLLLAEGYPADTMIEMWRPNTAEWALRGRLGAVAATVIDGEKALGDSKNGSSVRDLSQDSTEHLSRRHSRKPRFWRPK
jgi:hypothetical protein